MKKFITFLFIGLLAYLMITGLIATEEFPKYGEVSLEDRLSQSIVNKNVTEANAVVTFGESENLETGSANFVTSIIANYRSFDTLGEVTVLFVSALGVSLALGSFKERMTMTRKSNFILRVGSKMIFGLILVTGVFIFTHGHLTPGGGFPGGSMIASAILLMYLSDNKFRANIKAFKATESIAGSIYVITGLLGLVFGGFFLYNFLPTGVVGEVISAGIIPIVYILVGLKVGSELTGVLADFLTEEVE